MLRRRPFSTPSRAATSHSYYAVHRRKIALAYAQQVATAHPTSTVVREDGAKPAVSVQVSRPPLPCEKPLPLANVIDVQRLLYLLEAPEYCMRAFREHSVNGQDIVNMDGEDLNDSRFKFPRHVQRKVLRIAEAWRSFQVLNGGPTQTSLSLERFLDHYRCSGRSPETLSEAQAAFMALDVNNNGSLTFEEYLVGFTLLEAAAGSPPCTSSKISPISKAVTSIDVDVADSSSGALPSSLGASGYATATSVAAASAAPAATATPNPTTRSDATCSGAGVSFLHDFMSWLRL